MAMLDDDKRRMTDDEDDYEDNSYTCIFVGCSVCTPFFFSVFLTSSFGSGSLALVVSCVTLCLWSCMCFGPCFSFFFVHLAYSSLSVHIIVVGALSLVFRSALFIRLSCPSFVFACPITCTVFICSKLPSHLAYRADPSSPAHRIASYLVCPG